jgi:hypothetical protein
MILQGNINMKASGITSCGFSKIRRFRGYAPPKHRYLLEPHGAIFQKKASLIFTAVKVYQTLQA